MGFGLYLFGVVSSYAASTIYHAVPSSEAKVKGIVWLAAVVGTSLSFRKMKKQSYIETACYVLMRLTILIAFKPFYDSCGLPVVLWVVGEGIAYITGAVLYSFKKIPYIHSLFHLFVILGDICHMIATWMVIQMFIL